MQKLRKTMVAVASAAMVLGTMGVGAASAASSTATCVSRAQFIYDFDVAGGIMPVYPATSDFSDVASSSPYYGYIEAAFKAGYVNGTGNGQFSPSGCLTRAQIAKIEVLALGDGAKAAADATSATTFTDDSQVPSWARGYVVEAVALGLVHGYPDGSFAPNATMTATDEGYFLTQYKTTENALALTVTASANDVAPGQQVTLSSTGTSEPVTYSTTAGAVINGGTFVGSTPGNYTVTASTAQGLTGTVKIAVYGAATGVKLVLPSTVVANQMSQYTATADVVDANGNTVANSTDSIKLNGASTSIAGIDDNGTSTTNTLAAVNGVASFTIDAGSVAGGSEQLTAADQTQTLATDTETLTATAQVATSLSVAAPIYVESNNGAGQVTVNVTVEDQTGNPMISGTYSVSASLTGPGVFDADGTTGPDTSAYVGALNGGQTTANFKLDSVQSETGAITLTASGTGLTSGTGTTTAVIAGAPAAIQISPETSNTFSQDAGSTGLTYDIQVVDSHGYPVGVTEPLSFSVLNANGVSARALVANGGNDWTAALGTSSTASDGTDTLTITDFSFAANAGTYTLQVLDGTGGLGLTASSTETITETAGVARYLANSNPTYVSAASPTATYSAQMTDVSGNNIAEAGVPITFTPDVGNPNPFTNNSAVTVDTNASGVATASFTAPPYTGDTYGVTTSSGTLLTDTTGFRVESTIAAGVTVTIENGSTPQSVFTSGAAVNIKIDVTDQYGNAVTTADQISLTYGGTGGLLTAAPTATIAGGTVTLPDTVTTAGTITVTATDASVAAAPSGSSVLDVNAGAMVGWGFFDASGNLLGSGTTGTGATVVTATGTLTATASTPVEVWMKPIDAHGNTVVLGGSTPTTVTLSDSHGGTWRTTANGSDVGTYSASPGTSQVALWYVNANNETGITLDGDAQ